MVPIDPREAAADELAMMPFNLPVREPQKFGAYADEIELYETAYASN